MQTLLLLALAASSAHAAVLVGNDYNPAWISDRCTSIIVGADASGDGGPASEPRGRQTRRTSSDVA